MCQLVLLLIVGSCLSVSSRAHTHSHILWQADKYPGETQWVSLYRKLENALLSRPKLLDVLREKFFPSRSEYQANVPASIDGIEVLLIPMCITFSNKTLGLDHNHNGSISKCLMFRWTNSRLLNLDQLSALDPFWTNMLYSAIVSSPRNDEIIVISLDVNMDNDIVGAYPNEEDIVLAMTILLSWVSIINSRVAQINFKSAIL